MNSFIAKFSGWKYIESLDFLRRYTHHKTSSDQTANLPVEE
ncbi:hypothetical protein BSMD_027810 [Bacillus subtilis Miyagi-4]|nr:hypothetical protein BSNT_10207 [Bacillus subtilis subsp. natto BEST195]GAK80866.1 hypothetical protein BSMD_027810 [Bacillus subtilis Miyagi-4]